jgi:hypothetical protein
MSVSDTFRARKECYHLLQYYSRSVTLHAFEFLNYYLVKHIRHTCELKANIMLLLRCLHLVIS